MRDGHQIGRGVRGVKRSADICTQGKDRGSYAERMRVIAPLQHASNKKTPPSSREQRYGFRFLGAVGDGREIRDGSDKD